MTARNIIPLLVFSTLLPAVAQTNINWTGSSDQQWNNFSNWSPMVVPCNTAMNTYNAFLGGGAGTVFVPTTCTLEFLDLQLGAEISINDGITLGIRDGATNHGVIRPNGGTFNTGVHIDDSSGDDTVIIGGLGEIVLSNTKDRITGTTNDIFGNGGSHTVRGFGQIGANTVLINNEGSIIADSFGNTLVIDPRGTFTQNGDLIATNGGILKLMAGTFDVHPSISEIRVDDNSEVQFDAITMNGGSLDADNIDSVLSNNRVVVTANSTINGTRNQAYLVINNGRTLSVTGGDMVNNGRIIPDGTAALSAISFSDSFDDEIELSGSGRIVLDNAFDQVSGAVNDTLIHNAPHLIEGGGKVGANTIDVVNHSGVTANNSGVTLIIDPRNTWDNDGGTVTASGGATALLNPGTYTCLNGGRFVVGDGCEIELAATTMIDGIFDPDNGNGTLTDNIYHITGTSGVDGGTNNATFHIDNGLDMNLNGGDFTNNGTIHLNGASSTTSVGIVDGSDDHVRVLGSGSIKLDNSFDSIDGTANYVLEHGASHTIEGAGKLGANAIDIVNHGLIQANINGGTLLIDPRNTFVNDAGTVQAVDGGIIHFAFGDYSPLNGGQYLLGDGSRFDLVGVTMRDVVLDVIDVDLDLANNLAHVTTNSVFTDVTNETNLHVDDGKALNINSGDLINNATITLDGGTFDSSLTIHDSSDLEVQILGTGTLFIDDPARDKIFGTTNHVLVHGMNHTIEGAGVLGTNSIDFINHGLIQANLNAATLKIDPRNTFVNDGGTLQAVDGGIIRFEAGAYSPLNGGKSLLGDDCRFDLVGVTMQDLVLDVIDLDVDLSNNPAHVVTNSTFIDVTNEANLHVDNGRRISVTGGDLTNNATITLDGAAADASLVIHDGSDLEVQLLGTGTVFLDDPVRDTIFGTTNHTLVHGANHTIEGSGKIGTDAINIVNHGQIEANIAGQTLTVRVRDTFVNDGGSLHATNGATALLASGLFSSANGGDYRIFDGAAFELETVTLTNLSIDVDNGDVTLANNTAMVVTNCTFSDITNNARVKVNNGRTLAINPGDLTNNGIIELDSTGSVTALSIHGPGDSIVVLNGTGRVQLDHASERITGTTNHTLVHETGHTIEGGGNIGFAAIYINNRGTITANNGAIPLILDGRLSNTTNRGTLQAIGAATLDINDAVSHQAGLVFAEAGALIDINSVLAQSGGTTRVDGDLIATSFVVSGGIVEGNGEIDAPLSATTALVSPGTSTGTLTVDGGVTLGSGSSLRIEVNATADADQLLVTGGGVTINQGALQLVYTGGPASVQPADVFTIVMAGGSITNQFINAPHSQRLTTIDGFASFIVSYGVNTVTLSDFIHNPGGATNQAPIFVTTTTSYSVAENTPAATPLATFKAYDPEGALVTYSITPGLPFSIDSNTGELITDVPLDFETQSSYNLDVTASDGTLQTDLAITIEVDNIIETNQESVTLALSAPGGAFPGVTDLNIVGVAADPDGDSRSNIFELWRGTDAATPDLPAPLILEAVFLSGADRGTVIVETDAVMDDQLAIEVEFSFDLDNWRDATGTRAVLGTAAGIRTLRYFDPLALPPGSPFFVRFIGDPNAEL